MFFLKGQILKSILKSMAMFQLLMGYSLLNLQYETVFPVVRIFPPTCKLLILQESHSVRIKVQDLMTVSISGQNVATHVLKTYELKW